MSQVLPEFVNKIVNRVTSNNNPAPAVATPATPANTESYQSNEEDSALDNLGMENEDNAANKVLYNSKVSNSNSMRRSSSAAGNNNINNRASASRRSSNSNNNAKPTANNKTTNQAAANNLKFDNLTNAKSMRELLDSVMTSNLAQDKRNRLLNVIKAALTSTQSQENRDFEKLSQRYDFTNPNFMPGGFMPLPPHSMGMGGGYMPLPQQQYPPYYLQQGGYQSASPYFNMQQPGQSPNMMYDVLFNKMNMMQMEMADLTRHLRDYTRRYMDNMRESDMDQIKNYIDELMRVQESVNEVNNTMTTEEEPEEETTPSGIIDKAKNTIKSGLSTVTNTVNSIGNTLGLTSASSNEPTPANNKANNTKPAPAAPAAPAPPAPPAAPAAPAAENNMVSLEDYDSELNSMPASMNQGNVQQPTGKSQDELSNAITELNAKNQVQTGGGKTQTGGAGKKKKRETSILEQFERMLTATSSSKQAKPKATKKNAGKAGKAGKAFKTKKNKSK